jgi:hypothetical protein
MLFKHAVRLAFSLALLKAGKQHGRKNGDDGNHNQQLDQRKCRPTIGTISHHSHVIELGGRRGDSSLVVISFHILKLWAVWK